MKAVILAGGYGTRISEETHLKPKPMVEVGNRPVLWHILKIYSQAGINEFIVCCGYKGYVIKEYFANYFLHNSDVTFDMADNSMEVHHRAGEPWKVTLAETGEETMTGGRVAAIRRYVEGDELFLLTYGDGVSDVDVARSIAFHRAHGKIATVTAVRPPGRFGEMRIEDGAITEFNEKPQATEGFINGGFFVLDAKRIWDYLGTSPRTILEREPLQGLARDRELVAFPHTGFWQPMDTAREYALLNELWASGKAPWKTW